MGDFEFGMARSLHPDEERARYVTVWCGDSFRLYEPPPPEPRPDYSHLAPPAGRPRKPPPAPNMERVFAAITAIPQTAKQIADVSGVNRATVDLWVFRLALDGRILRIGQRVPKGRPMWVYTLPLSA